MKAFVTVLSFAVAANAAVLKKADGNIFLPINYCIMHFKILQNGSTYLQISVFNLNTVLFSIYYYYLLFLASNPVGEFGPYFQGDIAYFPKDIFGKNGLIDERYRWPNGKVPYTILENGFRE